MQKLPKRLMRSKELALQILDVAKDYETQELRAACRLIEMTMTRGINDGVWKSDEKITAGKTPIPL